MAEIFAHAGIGWTKSIRHNTYEYLESPSTDFSGRVIAITGASSGIGRATAIAFAKNRVGGLALIARRETGLAETAHLVHEINPDVKVLQLTISITDLDAVGNAAKRVRGEFGRLDVLINNAGALEIQSAHIADEDPDVWSNTMDVNIRGTFLVTRAFLPLLLDADGGSKTIINTSSLGAHVFAAGRSAYCLSKFAGIRLTQITHEQYKDRGIVAVAVDPGLVFTELSMKVPEAEGILLPDSPELPANTFVWLCREKKGWLSGRYLSAQWDMEEVEQRKEEIVSGDKLKMRMVF